MEAIVELHLTGLDIVVLYQGTGVVHQQVLRDPTEVRERRLDPPQPAALALVVERHHAVTPRVAQGGDEQVNPHLLFPDPYPLLAKVDLHLLARGGLEAHRRPYLGLQLPAPRLHRPLHRAQRDRDLVLGHQLLADHFGVAAVTLKALLEPLLQPLQPGTPLRAAVGHPTTLAQVTLDRGAAHPQFAGDPPGPPSTLVQLQHRCDLLGLAHRLSSLSYCQRRAVVPESRHRLVPFVSGGSVFDVAQGSVFHVA